jgi:hypothetical protein
MQRRDSVIRKVSEHAVNPQRQELPILCRGAAQINSGEKRRVRPKRPDVHEETRRVCVRNDVSRRQGSAVWSGRYYEPLVQTDTVRVPGDFAETDSCHLSRRPTAVTMVVYVRAAPAFAGAPCASSSCTRRTDVMPRSRFRFSISKDWGVVA